MKKIILKITEFLKYPSTWSGILKVAGGLTGYSLSSDLATQIIAAGVACAGLISMCFSDADVTTEATAEKPIENKIIRAQ